MLDCRNAGLWHAKRPQHLSTATDVPDRNLPSVSPLSLRQTKKKHWASNGPLITQSPSICNGCVCSCLKNSVVVPFCRHKKGCSARIRLAKIVAHALLRRANRGPPSPGEVLQACEVPSGHLQVPVSHRFGIGGAWVQTMSRV